VKGYSAIAITDHASASNFQSVIEKVRRDSDLVKQEWKFNVLVGIELTHCPARSISRLAAEAKEAGADIVVVHGETLVEPVPPGTNQASAECGDVDILAHPGLLTKKQASIARENSVFLEVTSRRGHCLGNGNTVVVARETGAKMLINSDTHSPSDLHTEAFAKSIGLGAGLTAIELATVLEKNPLELLQRVVARSNR